MNQDRYTPVAILLHWFHAILILGLLGVGWWMTDLPKGPDKTFVYGLHKSFGLCALALILVRTLWRLTHTPPPLPTQGWEARLATYAHDLLYLLLWLVPLSGFLSASFTPYPMRLFGIPLPKPFAPDELYNRLFNQWHQWLTLTLAALLVLHLAGVIYHRVRKDGVPFRMSFRYRGSEPSQG